MESKLINILLIAMMLCYIGKAVMEAERSTDGFQLARLQQEIVEWKVKNGEIKAQDLEARSLSHIDHVARTELGMVDAKYVYFPW